MLPRAITLLFGVFVLFDTHGNNKIDSLLSILTTCPDSSKYTVLTNLADAYYYDSQLQLSANYYKKAANLEELKKEPDLRKISESYGNYGYCLNEMGQFTIAIHWYNKALDAAIENSDSTEIATQYSNIGVSYYLMGNYEQSINNYQNALAIDMSLNTAETIGVDYSVIGNVFAAWDKHEKAKEFFHEALSIAREIDNKNQISIRLNKLGSSCNALHQYDSALLFLNESLIISNELPNNSRKATVLNQIGTTYQNSGKHTMAKEYYQRSLIEMGDHTDIQSEALLYVNMAENYYSLKEYDIATEHCAISLEKALEIGLSNVIMKSYETLAKINTSIGNYKKALEYTNLHIALKDSIFTINSQKKISEFQVIFETEKKDTEIKLLNSQRLIQEVQIKKAEQRMYFFIIVILLLVILFALVYYQYSSRKRINSILAEKNEQLGILNSTKDKFISIIAHDLKNPFSAFTNITTTLFYKKSILSETESDRLTGSLYHSSIKLKEMLNSLLDWAKLQKDNLEVEKEELNLEKVVKSQIELSLDVAASKNITVLNQVDKELFVFTNKNTIQSVINNLLTNAIKFSSNNQTVKLLSEVKNNYIKLIVEDNGIGLSKLELKQLFRIDVDTRTIGNSAEKGTGMGLILCKELLEKVNGTIDAESEIDKGSRFTISFPIT